MTEYCRLCAELKDLDEIVASIDDVEQLMERKLRVCCQWTTENTEHSLPHSVCLICLDKLEKCWLFAQSVQLAQQRLLEIFECDTKPLAVELIPNLNQPNVGATGAKQGSFECQLCVHTPFTTHRSLKRHLVAHVNNSEGELKIDGINNKTRIVRTDGDGYPILLGLKIYECKECYKIFDQQYYLKEHQIRCTKKRKQNDQNHKDLTSAFVAQINTFNMQSLNDQGEQNPEHICDNCSLAFCTLADLDAHQQQECDGLVETESNFIDLKPSVGDFVESESEMDTGENQATGDNDDDRLEAIDEHITNSERRGGRKNRSNGKLYTYKCETCDRTFRSSANLKQHNKLHDPAEQGPFECPLCNDKQFKIRRLLKRHLIAHVNNSKGELKIEQINGKAQIIRTNGDGDPIPLGVKIFKCDECNRIFNDKHLLKDHLIRHAERRKFDVGESINQMNQKGPFKCQLCDKMYGRKQHLCEHLVRHVLLSKGELRIEEIKHKIWKKPIFQIVQANGGAPIRIPGKVNVFNCRKCGHFCTNKSSLENHQLRHSKERPFECWLCHKMFKSQNSTQSHLKTHIRDGFTRNHICEVCGNAFKSSMALTLHKQMKHSDERPYKCKICGLGVKIEYQLKKHLLTHSEVPQFQCNLCDKAFRTNYSLKHHLQTHAGKVVKKFVCDYCSMGFRTNEELKDHRSMHTGEKRFKCEHCSSDFGARSSFYTHLRKVHGVSMLALKKEKLRS